MTHRYIRNIKSLSILSACTLISAGLALATQVFLARILNPTALGNYSAIFYLTTTIAPLCGFGISQYLLKIFGQHGKNGFSWVKPSINFVLLSTIFIFVFLQILAVTLQETSTLKTTASIMSIIIFGNIAYELKSSILQIEEKYSQLAIWQLSQNLLRLIFLSALFLIANNINETNIAIAYALASIAITTLSLKKIYNLYISKVNIITHKKSEEKNPDQKNITSLEIIKSSAPFGLSAIFYLIYYQTSIVFVKQFVNAEQAGYYSVAFTIISAAMLIPGVIYQKFLLPKLHRWAYHNQELFKEAYIKGSYIMLAFGIISTIFIWLLTPTLIPLVFGDKYNESIKIAQLLSLSLPFIYLASSSGSVLTTRENMKYKVKYMGLTAMTSILLNIILIPSYGITAAIYTSIFCNILLLLLYLKKSNLIINQMATE